jgi:hypothetical protein
VIRRGAGCGADPEAVPPLQSQHQLQEPLHRTVGTSALLPFALDREFLQTTYYGVQSRRSCYIYFGHEKECSCYE